MTESFTETMGNLVPVKVSEPPWTPLLNGVVLLPQRMLVVKAVSNFERADGDLGFQDGRVVDRLQRAGTEGAGDARAGTGIQGGRLEAADRDALGTEGDDADDLGVIETDPDRLLKRHRPDFLRLGVVGRPRLGQPRKLERHGGC